MRLGIFPSSRGHVDGHRRSVRRRRQAQIVPPFLLILVSNPFPGRRRMSRHPRADLDSNATGLAFSISLSQDREMRIPLIAGLTAMALLIVYVVFYFVVQYVVQD
ncbi:hypothetical protein Hsc_2434 [Herbaspirillum seropedicae]|nr:hypothetical protein Hsc_2434 [Herbaspirillum seropedicae]